MTFGEPAIGILACHRVLIRGADGAAIGERPDLYLSFLATLGGDRFLRPSLRRIRGDPADILQRGVRGLGAMKAFLRAAQGR